MKNHLLESYFKSIEKNPLKFTNILLSEFLEYGNMIDINPDYMVNRLDELIYTYNNHLPNTKYLNADNSALVIDSYMGDLPLLILILYLIHIDDELMPISMTNLNTLFGLIQETFNELVDSDLRSNYKINDMTEILILQIVTQVRD